MNRLGDAARDRARPLRTLVNARERAVIEANARQAGLTVSAYLRAAAVGTRVQSALDFKAIQVLSKVNADQGRLGSLLKMYLQDQKPDRRAAERLLAEIEHIQADLKAAARRVRT